MNSSQIGLLTGLILGATGALGGFSAVVIALAVGVLGLVIGRVLDGELDLGDLLGRGRDK